LRRTTENNVGLLLGLEDLFATYRRFRFGTSTPHATVVGVYNVDTRVVEWRQVKGMLMGLSASPLSFCRIPTAICTIAQVWCAVCVESFVDDYMIVDRDDAPITVRPRTPQGAPPRVWASLSPAAESTHDLTDSSEWMNPSAPVHARARHALARSAHGLFETKRGNPPFGPLPFL
jgi:hypothetical protein